MKNIVKFCILILISSLIFCSCSKLMGYGVLLWSVPEYNLEDGEIVPVYIKSNISQTYVIGTHTEDERIEVPLWQITDPVSKGKIESIASKYSEYKHIYAKVALDGLPMREAAVNTSKQVYRLRKDEVIKILYKGEGQPVMSGGKAMEGDWLRVLAKDGTLGWCFSYNLRPFDETEVQEIVVDEEVEAVDTQLETLLATKWYPENYETMIKRQRINLDVISSVPAIDFGVESGNVRFKTSDINVNVPYTGIEKISEKNYKILGTNLSVIIKNSKLITIQSPNEKGLIISTNLIALDESVDKIIQDEIKRRETLYSNIQEISHQFSSSNYGTLQFQDGNRFVWSGYQLLSPNVIPKNSGSSGTVVFDYFLDASLAFIYDGAFSFTFDKNGEKVVFLYKIEENGIRLEDGTKASIKDNLIKARGSSPVVMFFSAE
ncbi:MAG: SH3 domain-containing protein [Spirochaetaceae bacterium]|nr:SH3 domain-containing protein [Spirochaetaceae bacterium]